MDYGIGATLNAALRIYDDASRQSGRTSLAMRALREGDVFVVHNDTHAQWVRKEFQDAGINVTVVTMYKALRNDGLRGVSPEKVIFDHCVVQIIYKDALNRVNEDLRRLSRIPFLQAEETQHTAPCVARVMHEAEMLKETAPPLERKVP